MKDGDCVAAGDITVSCPVRLDFGDDTANFFSIFLTPIGAVEQFDDLADPYGTAFITGYEAAGVS